MYLEVTFVLGVARHDNGMATTTLPTDKDSHWSRLRSFLEAAFAERAVRMALLPRIMMDGASHVRI